MNQKQRVERDKAREEYMGLEKEIAYRVARLSKLDLTRAMGTIEQVRKYLELVFESELRKANQKEETK